MWSVIEFKSGLSSFYPQIRTSLIRGASLLSQQIGVSFSRALGNSFRQTIARILSKARMNPSELLSGHISATVARCQSQSISRIIVAQDSTYYNYSGQSAMEGLGSIQGNIKGLVQHNCLAVSDSGIPLGLIYQRSWTRGGLYALEKESQKWFEGLEAVNEHLACLAKPVVLVQDREADIFDFFQAQRAEGVELLVRVHYNRTLELAQSQQIGKLTQTVKTLPQLGIKQVKIRRKNSELTLSLSIQAAEVNIFPSQALSSAENKTQGLSLVLATEVAAVDKAGQDRFDPQQAAQWVLLTSLKVDQFEQAAQVVHYYALRWVVERFHYTCKSGALQLEKLQFNDVHTTCNALAFYAIIAWRILFLTLSVRQTPRQDPKQCFNPWEIKVLIAHDPKANHSLEQAVKTLGKLVNFVPTSKQPFPGIKIMAQALHKLNTLSQFLRKIE